MKPRYADAAAVALVVAFVVVFYRRITRLWWTMDDAFHLHFLSAHEHLSYLGRAATAALPFKLFTPLLFLSLDSDLATAGLNPRAFYLHQLVSLVLMAIACYALMRWWGRPWIACTGTVLLIAGAPFCTIAQQLMLRHYIEGLFFAAVAATLFVLSVRRGSTRFEVLSAVAYFAAAVAKEIYVPLPFVLLLLPERDVRSRALRLRAHAIALAVYVALRWFVLDTLGGGYGFTVTLAELPHVFTDLLMFSAKTLAGTGVAAIVLGIVVIAAIAIVVRHRRAAALAVLIAFVIAVAPVLPVAKAHEARYALALWLLGVTVIVSAANVAKRAAIVLLVPALLATLIVNRTTWTTTFDHATRMSREGRWFVAADADTLLRNPEIPPAAIAELTWFRSLDHKPAGTTWSYDDVHFCSASEPRRVFEYDEQRRAVIETTARVRGALSSICNPANEHRPLSATFDYRDDALHWKLGPYTDGRYRLIIGEGAQAFDVPREDTFRLPGAKSLTLRVLHVGGGTRAISPPLTLDFARHPAAEWRQNVR